MKLGLGKNRSKLFLVVFLAFATLLPSAFYPLSLGGKAYGQTVSPNDSLEEIKSKKEDYLYKNTNPNFEITLGSKKDKHIPRVTYSYSDRGSLSFSLKDSATTSLPSLETVTNQKPKLIYRNTLPKVDISYEIEKGRGIKEEIILNSPPADMQGRDVAFVFEAETSSGAQLRQTIDGLWYFTDESDNYLFHIEKPFMEDAKGVISNDVKIEVKETQNQNLKTKDLKSKFQSSNNKSNPKFETNSKLFRYLNLNNLNLFRISDFGFRISEPEAIKHYTITVIASGDWLRSASTAYPVAIDPTVTHNADANFTGQMNRIADNDSTSSTQLESSYGENANDPYTVLNLHFNEANGTTAGIRDYASTTRVITANGNASTTNYVTQLGMGNSAAFDGTSDWFSIPDSDDWNFGSGDFSIDFWVNPNNFTGASNYGIGLITQDGASSSYWGIFARTTASSLPGEFDFQFSDSLGNTVLLLQSTSALTAGVWNHIALVRSGSKFTLYKNGIDVGSGVSAAPIINLSNSLLLGDLQWSAQKYYFNGYLDSLRILKGRALTPEEIKAAASRRPYAVYTSSVLDATASVQWDTVNWTEGGVKTGDGETIYNSSGLVAQWNFNETSGTAATSSTSGSCQTCAGTLNGFSYTASQDQATTTTGWTANNKKWGAGSLMFDGTNDYVSVNDGAVTLSGFTAFTATMWVNQSSIVGGDVSALLSNDQSGNSPYVFYVNTSRQPYWYLNTANGTFNVTSPISMDFGKWHFLTYVYNGSTMSIYVNGIFATSTPATGTMDTAANAVMRIGMRSDGALPFNGIIDSTAIYSRALSAAEILSNYQAGNIEIQTRTGATSDPNDGTWEAWKPTTGETQLLSMDSDAGNWNAPQQIDGYTKLLLHMDGTDTATTFPNSATTTHTITANGNAQVDTAQSKFGGGSALFDGNSDYLTSTDSSDWNLNTSESWTVDFWLNKNGSQNDYSMVAGQVNSSGPYNGWDIEFGGSSDKLEFYANGSSGLAMSKDVDNGWHHYAFIHNDSNDTLKIYVDGKEDNSRTASTMTVTNVSRPLEIGARENFLTTRAFNGHIDEFRISKGIARWTSNFTPPPRAYGSNVKTENETTIKQEGTASTKLTLGAPQIDGNTVALWHFEETGTTTGTYLYDETANNNDATTTGTTVADGIFGKARKFNGTTGDYVSAADTSVFNSIRSVSLWVYPLNTVGQYKGIIGNIYRNTDVGWGIWLTDGKIWGGWHDRIGSPYFASSAVVSMNTWYHVVAIATDTEWRLYINGKLDAVYAGVNYSNYRSSTFPLDIAGPIDSSSGYFNGLIDEVQVLNRVLSADEIAETYRMGANHHLTRQVSAVDLSGANKLAFNIASDRPGTYLEAMIGESDYANYELASSTLALSTTTVLYIKGDEIASSTSIKDSSFSGKAITANGNARTSGGGKIGNSVYFDGTGDYLDIGSSSDIPTGNNVYSVDFWLRVIDYSTDFGGGYNGFIFSRGSEASNQGHHIAVKTDGSIMVTHFGNDINTGFRISTNTWYHVVDVWDGSNEKLYINGVLVNGDIHSQTLNVSNTNIKIGRHANANSYFLNGYVDELRLLKTALTPDQIRQAYEYGLRSHQITIDFGATLQPSDLISNASDYNFSITATTTGLSATTSGLYLGDKIIIKENRSGTEYTAQGTVNSINTTTGAITVPLWDSGSSFPSGGFTQYATVFKWQREYFDLTGAATTTRNSITNLTLRPTNNSGGRTIYLDDFKYNTNYLTASSSSAITSSNGRYMQYRVIFSSWDSFVSPFVSSISTAYTSLATMFAPMIGVSGGGFMSF